MQAHWDTLFRELHSSILSRSWDVAKSVVNKIYSLADDIATIKPGLNNIVAIISLAPVNEEKLKTELDHVLAQLETEKKASLLDRITNEEEIQQELKELEESVKKSFRIIANFWRRGDAKDYQQWLKLTDKLKTTPLTRIGRLRLQVRLKHLEKKIIPDFLSMVIQLWPIAALWAAKQFSGVIIKKVVASRKRLEGGHDGSS